MALDIESIQSFTDKLEMLVANPNLIWQLEDDTLRRRLREASRKLSRAMENTGDTTHRLNNTVSGNSLIYILFSVLLTFC